MSRVKGVFLAFGVVSLVGCGSGGDVQALEAQLREIRQRPPMPIEAVPQPVSRQRFVYDPASLRDPFQLPSRQIERATGRSALRPDPERLRGVLEGFAIEQFEMVGTLSRGEQTFALLQGATAVHRLAVGDYLGPDHGQVTAIYDSHIELVELFPDGEGVWLERSRTLALNVHS